MKKRYFFILVLVGWGQPAFSQVDLTANSTALKAKSNAVKEDHAALNEIKRDPFRLPEYLINKFKRAKITATPEGAPIDDSVEPIRRWPLRSYTLIGIIWDVKNPKALIADMQRKVHLVRIHDKIGNIGGIITDIREGSIIVIQDKVSEVLQLKK